MLATSGFPVEIRNFFEGSPWVKVNKGGYAAMKVNARNYTCKDFAKLEGDKLWPRVWQMACREEEIPTVGDYYTYDILDDSVIVVRSAADTISAYHNACTHRGRLITEGCGRTQKLHCKFHGWQWDLAGRNILAVDREDWEGCLKDEDIALKPVKVGRWGGWVYINMDSDCEPLEDFLSPAREVLDPLDLAGLRYQWRKSAIVECNWKVALDAFNEGYHVQTTHSQMLPFFDDKSVSYSHGRHAMFAYWGAGPLGSRSPRLGAEEEPQDIRLGIFNYMKQMAETLNAGSSVAMLPAARRLVDELPADTPPMEVLLKLREFTKEHIKGTGADFPEISMEQAYAVGTDWHLFPNQVFLPSAQGLLGYRARPHGDDLNSCIWDVYSLQRYAKGTEPEVKQEWNSDLTDQTFWGKILTQDYSNMAAVQRGMRTRGFSEANTNPRQEVAVYNFHRALEEFIGVKSDY